MKIALVTIILVIAIAACGCTGTTSSLPQTPAAAQPAAPVPAALPSTPDMVGTWTGTMLGYEEGTGFTDYNNLSITMVVTEQKGRLFTGHFTFGPDDPDPLAMAGLISRDGRTFSIVENTNGFTSGEFTGTDTIELTHVDDSEPYSVALDTLRRV